VKLQCELCREVVDIDHFESDAAGLTVQCPDCNESYFIAAKTGSVGERVTAAVAASPLSDSEQGRRCPKCESLVRDEALSCRGCGLLANNFESYRRDAETAVSDALADLWTNCREAWDDDDAHERFAEMVAASKDFAFAARVYRRELRSRPDDDKAATRLDRISQMAQAAYLTAPESKEKQGDRHYKTVVILLIALVVLAAIGGLILMMRSSQEPKGPVLYDEPPPALRR